MARLQLAMDQVRQRLSDTLGIDYPAVSLLLQTPSEKYFVTSAAAGQPRMTAGTWFRFASNTKLFTATAILKMYQDGWLDYQAKIVDTIPGSSQTYVPVGEDLAFPHRDQITITQLLQHSSGVFDVDNDPVPGCDGLTYTEFILKQDPGHLFTAHEMVNVLQAKNLSYFLPGAGYHYSNTGYVILATIIARVYSIKSKADRTYSDYLRDSIVGPGTPVPLSRLHFPELSADIRLPDPHISGTVLRPSGVQVYDAVNMSAQTGEGNGYGVMEDLNTFLRTLMRGENVLTPATVSLMQKEVSAANPTYGLGCMYRAQLGYGHNGARVGCLSAMLYDPDTDVSVVVMLPMWDLRKGNESFLHCLNALMTAGFAARVALGYPGKP